MHHRYQERDGEEDRKDESKRYVESVGLKVEHILDSTKWKSDIHYQPGAPSFLEKPEKKTSERERLGGEAQVGRGWEGRHKWEEVGRGGTSGKRLGGEAQVGRGWEGRHKWEEVGRGGTSGKRLGREAQVGRGWEGRHKWEEVGRGGTSGKRLGGEAQVGRGWEGKHKWEEVGRGGTSGKRLGGEAQVGRYVEEEPSSIKTHCYNDSFIT